jgi:hypothetical protein
MLFRILLLVASFFTALLNFTAEKLGTVIVFRFGSAIGDHVAMTAAIRHLAKIKRMKVVVLSNHEWIFEKNPRIFFYSSLELMPVVIRKYLISILSRFNRAHILEFKLKPHGSRTFEDQMKEDPELAKMHLVQIHTRDWPEKFKPKSNIPEIFNSPRNIKQRYPKLPPRFALIHSEGKKSYTPNKEWGSGNFQKVIDKTAKIINWVQIGRAEDAKLNNCLDLRGKVSLSELVYLFNKGDLGLFQEGLFSHLAAAANIRTYTIFTGFSSNSISDYPNQYAFETKAVSCAPCWLRSPCPNSMECIELVTPEVVSNKIIEDKNKNSNLK